MSVETLEFPGWLKIADAAERYGLKYETLRRLVKDDVFTRGRFTSASADTPPIYVKIAELDAWRSGGVDAVKSLREAPAFPPVVHEMGEAGA